MLPLEKQVTSLETSKKLRQLGVKQESLFYWVGDSDKKYGLWNCIGHTPQCMFKDKDDIFSAFTCSELGELLPKDYISKYSDDYKWMVYWWDWAVYKRYVEGQNTEVEARAKMLIYLLENKIITLEKTDEKISK